LKKSCVLRLIEMNKIGRSLGSAIVF